MRTGQRVRNATGFCIAGCLCAVQVVLQRPTAGDPMSGAGGIVSSMQEARESGSVSMSGVLYCGYYAGGPLDGQPATATGRNRWALYRDDRGCTLPTQRGDAEFIGRNRRQLQRRCFYVRQQVAGTPPEAGDAFPAVVYAYVYGPYLHAWLKEQGWRSPSDSTPRS